MRRQGVFIPLAQDIIAYCLTDNFISCPRYLAPPAQRPRKLRLSSKGEARRRPAKSTLQFIHQPHQTVAPAL
jgi:hypothetical protein